MKSTILARNLPRGRARLATLLRASGDVIRIDDTVRALDLPRTEAAKLLSRWVKQGWLRRVGTGAYVAVPLDALQSEHVLEDPWILVPTLFSPGYVGGRTAAEHWDLTEQIFRDIVVITSQTVRNTTQVHHGAQFALKHVKANKIFGTKSVWRGQTKIAVSDMHRTIIDMLEDPALGGGIQHVVDCLRVYFRRPDRDDTKLIGYAVRLGNGAVFKRLGFLAERLGDAEALVVACRQNLTKGNTRLDPALASPKLVTTWHLWIPERGEVGAVHD
jgi:predicted transcriptional regulator of viral defense system